MADELEPPAQVEEPDDFYAEPMRTPTKLGDMEVNIHFPEPNSGQQGTVRFGVQIKQSDGSINHRTGNLWPQLTPQERNQLQNFMQTVYARMESKIIPAATPSGAAAPE